METNLIKFWKRIKVLNKSRLKSELNQMKKITSPRKSAIKPMTLRRHVGHTPTAFNGATRLRRVTMATFSMDAVSNRNNAEGETASGGDGSGGRTKVMDGSWNPRRVNCWPLYVRLGDTLALPWPRKSMHPFVFSRALYQPLPLYPPVLLFFHLHTTATLCHHRRRGQPLLALHTLSLFLCLSAAALFFGPQKGELGGVGDVRLLHYVFLTEPPLTSTLSHPPRPFVSPLESSFFSLSPLFSFPMPTIPFRCFSLGRERILLVAEVFFFRARKRTFLLITRPVGVGRCRVELISYVHEFEVGTS